MQILVRLLCTVVDSEDPYYLSKIRRNFRKKLNIFSYFMIYYQSDNLFVSVATKMSRLDPDPARFVINRLPGSGSSNSYYASLDKSRL
jgi:hypothetical protein